jgi:hypothetical protein
MTTAFVSGAPVPHQDIALWRIYLLRAGYLLIAAGMGSQMWSAYLDPHKPWALSHGVMNAMLLSLVLLSLLGLRYPLKMLPLLFWEMAWKAIWLLSIALPAWQGDTMNVDIASTARDCSLIAIFLFIVPWDYIWRHFAVAKSERWR